MARMQNPIIVALDLPGADTALRLAAELAPAVGAFKIGFELFTQAGPDVVRRVRELGAPVFLDLKFHDIPNTVAKAVSVATGMGVSMLTLHTSGGPAMMRAAAQAARDSAARAGIPVPLVLGVTVLTSMDDAELAAVGIREGAAAQVERLARLAAESGIGGLVCSPLEVALLRRVLPPQIQLVTPGIRAGDDAAGDQKRTLSAAEAIAAGATWLVIGRPICAAPNPRAAAERILASLPGRAPAAA